MVDLAIDTVPGRHRPGTRLLCGLLLAGAFLSAPAVADDPSTTTTTCTQTAGPTRALGLFKPGQPVDLVEGFRDPPPISRAQCWWQSHGSAFTKEEITRQLEEFKTQGMGGVTVKDTLAMPRDEHTAEIRDIPFMSPEWLDLFTHVVSECGRLGLICRCRLGSGWNAGGPWVTPELSSQVLAFASLDPLAGPTTYRGPIPTGDDHQPTLAALKSGEAFVLAVSADWKTIDLSRQVDAGRRLDWQVPEGTWTLTACYAAPSMMEVKSASPSGGGLHHDHLSAAGTDLQLRHVAEPILAKLGDPASTAFDGFNCDSWELGKPTWTPGLRNIFLERCGYDPVPYLPALAEVEDDRFHAARLKAKLPEKQQRFLYDFRTVISDLIVETHYARISDWCRGHGICFEAEAGGPHTIPNDFLSGQGAVDIPMGEFWMHQWSHVKLASSAAHAYGKRLVALESFTETRNHFAIRPALMKQRVDEAFLLGGNYLTMAVAEYSPAAAGRPGWVHNAGPHLNHCQTWWPMARPFFDYLARCCFLLQSGRNVAQVAVYHTFRSDPTGLWVSPKDDDLANRPKQFAFDYVNDDLVQHRMRVSDGRIVLDSGASYQVLYVIPTHEPTMPLATLAKIKELAEQGATVVWAGERPTRCPGLKDFPACDEKLRKMAAELWRSGRVKVVPRHDYAQLIPILEQGAHPPAWRITGDPPLRFVHRRAGEADIFFVVNRATWPVETPVTFRITDRSPELWDPDTGAIIPAAFEKVADGVLVDLRLPALASTFVVFHPGAAAQPQRPAATGPVPEPIPIDQRWEVAFPAGGGAPPVVTFDELKSWSEMPQDGVRYFSGIATYRTTFTCPGNAARSGHPAVLDLGRVAEVCEVRLNGRRAGIAWHPPYRLDVTGALRPGENRLEVSVANLWHNRIVGDAALPKAERVTRMVPETHYQRMRDRKLIDSGLMGPVRIVFGHDALLQ